MVASSDPLTAGYIASLARPGGNVTGLTAIGRELSGKRLELLQAAVPGVSHVAVLWNAANPEKALDWQELQAAARVLGIQLQSLAVRDPGEFAPAFATAAKAGAQALVVVRDALIASQYRRLVELAATHRLPVMYYGREFVEAGGLMSYGPKLLDLFRRAAYYVDKILKGAKPADLPVEQPTQFELVLNLKTAEALGLTIPPLLLYQADEVIR